MNTAAALFRVRPDELSEAELFASLPEAIRDAEHAAMSQAEITQLEYDWRYWGRRKQFEPVERAWSTWLVLAGRGFGKALALDTPIATPTGWSTMGALAVGVQLFADDGQVCTVTRAHPIQVGNLCYRLTFSDGTEIVADADHEWLTMDKQARKESGRGGRSHGPRLRTTAHIAATLLFDERERNHSIALTGALCLPEQTFEIHPYVLGVWLGDGDSRGGTFTSADEEVVAAIAEHEQIGLRRGIRFAAGTFPARNDAQIGHLIADRRSLTTRLRRLGVMNNKHIPASYLRASEAQRRDLLAGLMDSDGSVTPDGHVEFCGVNDRLCRDVIELVRSIGAKPTWLEDRATLDGRDCGPRYRVFWTPHEPVFRLSRKLARQHTGRSQAARNDRRYIVAVDRVPSVPVRCISVDSPSRMFLAGAAMIPTHNSRTGAELVRARVETRKASRIALVARTAADVRDVLVEGPSGILNISPPWFRPIYEPGKRRVTWPNGAIATTFSADVVESFRGPEFDLAWCDELAAWRFPDAWTNLQFALRRGEHPQAIVTTTPKPIRILREIIADPGTIITRGSMLENRANLPATFMNSIMRKYAGTRLGRQEIDAELLDDVPGAMWQRRTIDDGRIMPPRRVNLDALGRVVVAVDPAGKSGEDADETGIVVVGKDRRSPAHGYVLADSSGHYEPTAWAAEAIRLFRKFNADMIVAEINYGGEMVEAVIRMVDPNVPVTVVHASRGKAVRADPVAQLYEQGRVHHEGSFAELEDQMCSFTRDFDAKRSGFSPDRMDALVWGFTECLIEPVPYEGMFDLYREMAGEAAPAA